MDPVTLALARRLPVTPEQATFLQVSSNYAVTSTLERGTLDTSTGEEITTTVVGRMRSQFIPIKPAAQYTSAMFFRRFYYNAEREFIGTVSGNSTFTTPADAAFLRFVTDNPDTVQLNIGSTLLDYEEYYEPFLKPDVKLDEANVPAGFVTSEMLAAESVGTRELSIIERSSNLVDRDALIEGTAILDTGELSSVQSQAVTPLLPVIPGEVYTANCVRFAFYSASGAFISQVTGGYEGAAKTATVPAGAAHMRVSFYSPQWNIAQINAGEELLEFEEFYERISPEYLPDASGTDGVRYQFDAPIDGVFLTEETYPALPGTAGTDSDEVLALWDDLAVAHPDYITVQELGDDALGNRIAAYHFNPEKPESPEPTVPYPKIFITCGVHGYEKISPFTTYYVMKHAVEKWRDYPVLEALRFNVDFIIIPIANPSGWQAGTRKNHNGVDLMRNFPTSNWWLSPNPESGTYGGPSPASEVETQYIMQVFEENPDIDVFYDFHNFHDTGAAVGDNFLWFISHSPVVRRQAQALITRMTRIWRDEHAFVTDNDLPGYVSYYHEPMTSCYAHEVAGVELSAVFETSNRWMLFDPNQTNIPIVWTSAINAWANWLLLTLKTLSR